MAALVVLEATRGVVDAVAPCDLAFPRFPLPTLGFGSCVGVDAGFNGVFRGGCLGLDGS